MSDIKFKIQQGTGKLTGTSLCRSCVHSAIYTDNGGEHVICNANFYNQTMPRGTVIDCNRYYNSTLPSLSSFEEIAWELKTEPDGGRIGFKPPEKKDAAPRR